MDFGFRFRFRICLWMERLEDWSGWVCYLK